MVAIIFSRERNGYVYRGDGGGDDEDDDDDCGGGDGDDEVGQPV